MTRPHPHRSFWRGRRSEEGASAIEFAFILPFIILLYAGTIDLNLYVSATRKVGNASGILSDLITQNVSVISTAVIDDSFDGAALAMTPIAAEAISLEVRNYRLVDDKVTEQWSRDSGTGPGCDAPDTTGLADLMAGGNDIVIATVCTEHEPAMSKALSSPILGASKFTITSEVRLRPRESSTLECLDC